MASSYKSNNRDTWWPGQFDYCFNISFSWLSFFIKSPSLTISRCCSCLFKSLLQVPEYLLVVSLLRGNGLQQKDEYFCEVQYGNGPYSTVYCISKLEIDRSRSRTNFVRLLNNALWNTEPRTHRRRIMTEEKTKVFVLFGGQNLFNSLPR